MAELRALVARAEAREEETRAAEGEKLTLRVRDKSNGYVPLRLPMYPVAEPGEVRSVIGALPRLHTISSPRSGAGRAELVAAPGCERRLFTAPCCEQVGGLTDEEPGGVSEAEREGRLCAPAPAEESQLSETVLSFYSLSAGVDYPQEDQQQRLVSSSRRSVSLPRLLTVHSISFTFTVLTANDEGPSRCRGCSPRPSRQSQRREV